MVTTYDAGGGRLADEAGVDMILVGDTAAEMVEGHNSTVPATMAGQIMRTRAVSGQVSRALVVGDLPFGAYESSDEEAVRNAIRLVKEGGADVVKLEGARPELVGAIRAAGIAVMGHLGLTPQSQTALGGRKVQGRTAESALRLLDQSRELEAAGCFALVFEAVPAAVAERVTQEVRVPTLGIGSGGGCDGQVLVLHDLLGLYEGRAPRFVKRYAEVGTEIRSALERFAAEVRSGAFPEATHTYGIPDDELERFRADLASRPG
jgi:3-methyl-2-oxobutanoate hydroxymethyltransferase